MVTIPDETWYSTIEGWLSERAELLVEYAAAGSCGSEWYMFCRSVDEMKEFLSTLPTAARIFVYERHSLFLRGMVDEDFLVEARQHMPAKGDFLVVSFEAAPYSSGYVGYLGDTLDELDEILNNLKGESVAFGHSPADDKECERIVAYKDGVVGSY